MGMVAYRKSIATAMELIPSTEGLAEIERWYGRAFYFGEVRPAYLFK